jgi:hypothetical protein
MEINQTVNDVDIQKFIQQAERKREYNKTYYQNRVKPKKEIQKHDLEYFRDRCTQLELELYQYQNNQIKESPMIEHLERQNIKMINENNELNQQISDLIKDNTNLRKLLEASRQRVYELMMKKSADILPSLQGMIL